MSEWLVELKGHEADLQAWCREFTSPKRNVSKEDAKYYLRSSDFDAVTDAWQLLDCAQSHHVDVMNGFWAFKFGNFPPVEIAGIVQVQPDGKYNQNILPPGIPSQGRVFPLTVTNESNQAIDQSATTDPIGELMNADGDVGAVFSIRGTILTIAQQEHKWVELYRAYEVIENNVGGEEELKAKSWISKRKLRLFKRTAQSYRHGPNKYSPLKNPMLLEDGMALLKSLIEQWLDWKIQQSK